MRKAKRWTVTRQHQWPDGGSLVEVSAGGIDYTNPDALCKKYKGELDEFTDPREAAEAAIAICKAWRNDGEKSAKVGHGATGGMTMPFDSCTFKELLQWAEETYEELPKCAQCGELMGDEAYGSWELGEFDCCSEYCAEEYYRQPEEVEA
jgi:hypothetical protein